MIPYVFLCLLEAAACTPVQAGPIRVDEVNNVLIVDGVVRYYVPPLRLEQIVADPLTVALFVDQDGDGDVLFRESLEEPCWSGINVRPPP